MSTGNKRPLSPLTVQGYSRQKAYRPNDHMESRAAPSTQQLPRAFASQWTQGEGGGAMFTFGGAQATGKFTFVPRYPLRRVAPPDHSTSSPKSDGINAPTTQGFSSIGHSRLPIEAPINEATPADDPMDLTYPSEHAGLDGERSGLADRSISPSGDTGLDRTVPRGPRLPYIPISARTHSQHQSRRREPCESDGMSAIEVVQYLSHPDSDVGVTDQPTRKDTQAPTPLTDVPLQPHHSPIHVTEVRSRDISENMENLYEGATPPQVNMNAPSTPPLRRVRTRGTFIIGNGAPIKIDEGIEVRLKDGADGQVDFII